MEKKVRMGRKRKVEIEKTGGLLQRLLQFEVFPQIRGGSRSSPLPPRRTLSQIKEPFKY